MSPDQAYEALRNHPDLPSPRGVALQIVQLTGGGQCSLNELAEVVQKDPAIVGRLLRVVNSSIYPHARPILTTTEAISYLGTRMVGCIALSFALLTERTTCKSFDYQQFWCDCLARAVAGSRVSTQLRVYVPDEVFTIALLSQIGRLALATVAPDRYDRLLSTVSRSRTGLAELERDEFGIDHNEFTSRLLGDWGLSEAACHVVRTQDAAASANFDLKQEPNRLTAIIALAGLISEQICKPVEHAPGLGVIAARSVRLGLRPDTVVEIIASMIPQWKEMLELFEVRQFSDEQVNALYAEADALREQLENWKSQSRNAS